MLATGGTIISAIKRLLERGVAQDNIVFINLVASPEGITALMSEYPKIRIVTAEIDPAMNDKKYIIPGLGDFGCRYFGTEPTREIQ
jgi:uracil phosphoribosyltransferase